MSADSPCLFAAEPLDRASEKRIDPAWVEARLADPRSVVAPLYKGDPLVRGDEPAFLSAAAIAEFPQGAPVVFLGLKNGAAYFAADVSAAPSPEAAPFADLGLYLPLREAAAVLDEDDLAIIGQARWLLDWHRRHRFCANCGAETEIMDGGAKRQCPNCATEHFPRSDPVAIVLAEHDGACLLGRNPRFPPGFVSALAGFVEAAETPEACAIREMKEEAGVTLVDVRYQFSQPWPFPSSLMMGFIATAEDRALKLDETEIAEAHWIDRADIRAMLKGEPRGELRLPPGFTIARQLLEKWAESA
ncbi:MAG: NAD(+) diphosphatase [Pseudomonadota bacterium]|nr:NAD(+) diphosphatase [Pseudomonadota bacterium]